MYLTLLYSASAVVFVGLIYLLILSFFIVVSNTISSFLPCCIYRAQMIGYGARQASGLNKMLCLRSIIIVRLISSFFAYFFLSVSALPFHVASPISTYFSQFFYSLLNLAFKLDLTRRCVQNIPINAISSHHANRYGHIGFFLFWMLNWIGMLSV